LTQLSHGRHDRPLIAILLCLFGMSLFSVQDALVKWLTTDYWLMQLLFVRSVVVVTMSGMFIFLRQGKKGFHTQQPISHLARMLYNFFAFLCYYLAVIQMPLAEASAIALTSPLIMTALAGPVLGEHVGMKRQFILLIGFIGVVIIIRPTADELNLNGSSLAIASAFLFAMLGIQNRKMGKSENSELMVFYSGLGFLLVTGMLMPFYWEAISLSTWLLMLLLGLNTLIAQFVVVQAFKYARVHVIAPFQYITVLWAILIGWLIFSEPPTATMLVGAAFIILAGLIICWYEKIEYNKNTASPITPV
jgi:S-adenosylmethionine uptake transporter